MESNDSIQKIQCDIRGRNVAILHLQALVATLDAENRDDTLQIRKIMARVQ